MQEQEWVLGVEQGSAGTEGPLGVCAGQAGVVGRAREARRGETWAHHNRGGFLVAEQQSSHCTDAVLSLTDGFAQLITWRDYEL